VAIVNVAVKLRLFKTAAAQLFALLDGVREQARSAAAAAVPGLKKAEVVILCRMSRLFLHQGALQLGISHCDEAMEVVTEAQLAADPVAMHVHLTRGLALFAISDYGEAFKIFGDLVQKQAAMAAAAAAAGVTAVTAGAPATEDGYAGAVCFDDVHCSAVNSYAVCALHLKQIEGSIRQLERLVLEDPARHMGDAIVFNLCTLYDLSCSTQTSLARKQVLRHVASLYHVQGLLNPKSYRL